MPEIHFLPWVEVQEPIDLGRVALEPYVRGSLPGDQPHAKQLEIDELLSFYRESAEELVHRCTLLRPAEKQVGDGLTDEEVAVIRDFSELLCCASLAERSFFGPNSNYCCKDDFQLHGHRWTAGTFNGNILIQSRRRDGYALNLTDKEYAGFYRPHHAIGRPTLREKLPLLTALVSASETSEPKDWDEIYSSVINFNLANTDSALINPQTEMILLYAAFQSVLGSTPDNSKFQAAVIQQYMRTSMNGAAAIPEASPIKARLSQKHAQGTGKPLIELWLEDFRRSRGSVAHGKGGYPAVWSVQNHLVLGSFLFPLLLKKRIAAAGSYEWTMRDQYALQSFDTLVQHDHFAPELFREVRQRLEHPWYVATAAAREEAQGEEMRKDIKDAIDRLAEADFRDDAGTLKNTP